MNIYIFIYIYILVRYKERLLLYLIRHEAPIQHSYIALYSKINSKRAALSLSQQYLQKYLQTYSDNTLVGSLAIL